MKVAFDGDRGNAAGRPSGPDEPLDVANWDEFVERAITSFGGSSGAVVVGLEDGAVWGSSRPCPMATLAYPVTFETEDGSECQIQMQEGQQLKNYCESKRVPPSGLRIGQKKLIVLRTQTHSSKSLPAGQTIFSAYGKCGGIGCCIALTGKAVVMNLHDSDHPAGHCNAVALRTATWLVLQGL